MRDGIKIIDMDTHVRPSLEILSKYVEPSFRRRMEEFKPYQKSRTLKDGSIATDISMGAIPFDRYPGTAPNVRR